MKKPQAKNNLISLSGKKSDEPLPKSLAIAEKGIHTGAQFGTCMSALMADTLAGGVTPSVSNAVCNAGGKLLKVVEMQQRWGTQQTEGGPRDLLLTGTEK